MKRRAVLKGLATSLAGAVTAAPAAAAGVGAGDLHAHQGSPAAAASAEEHPPRLLDEHQRRTLASLADMLVPGAVAAGAVDLVDRVAAVGTAERQRQLLSALGSFDGEARAAKGVRWIDLDEASRMTILQSASTAASGAFRDHFLHLRTLVANAYYATEPGMRELGWTGRSAWMTLPGCTHTDGHA
jgi:hypothetical protein